MDILKCLCISTPFHPHGMCVWGDIPDEVWISLVKRAQLPPIPSLEGIASSCMVTGVVPATTPPTLKLGIRECNVLKQNGVNDSFLLNIPLFRFLFLFPPPPSGCTGEALYAVLGASHCDWLLLLWVTLPAL